MRTLKKLAAVCLALMVFSAVWISPVLAWEHRAGDRLIISKDEIIQDDLIITAREVVVDGTIEGDLAVFAEFVTVNGKVNGDVLTASRIFNFNGQGLDDLRAAAEDVRINGQVKRNFSVATSQMYIDKGAFVGGNAIVGSERAVIQGPIEGKLQGGAGQWEINSPIGGDITVGAKRLSFGPKANIGGKVKYTSSETAVISPEAKIAGEVTQVVPSKEDFKKENERPSAVGRIIWFLVKLASLLIIWYIWQYLSPNSFANLQRVLRERSGSALGWGFMLLLLTPIIGILLLITVVGIPISILGMMVYFSLIYLSRIIVGYRLGEFLLQKIGRDDLNKPVVCAAVGVIALGLLGIIPFLGFWVSLAVVALGFGSVFLAIRNAVGKPEKDGWSNE